jgi:predicted GH43/DUF377 family glycosyl hydrolase
MLKWRTFQALLLSALILCWPISLAESLPEGCPDCIPSQGGWQFPLKNPVFRAGSFRHQALWDDPSPLKENGLYVLYLTTSIATPFKPPVVPFRLVSRDCRNWKLDPSVPVAMPTGTRFVSVETPSVVKFRGQYHMFFSGIYPPGSSALMAIGHAVSTDGRHFQVSPNPVISATGRRQDWNGVVVGEPGAIVRGSTIFVYFTAVGERGGHNQTIGLAKTDDGEHFTPPIMVLEQSPLYPPEKGFCGYSTPFPFELHGKVHLLYDVAMNRKGAHPEWQQVALHHAVSLSDGQGDFVQDTRPIFTRNDFPWTKGEIIGPGALVDGNEIKLWFAGHVPLSELGQLINRDYNGDEFGVNYAVRPAADFSIGQTQK